MMACCRRYGRSLKHLSLVCSIFWACLKNSWHVHRFRTALSSKVDVLFLHRHGQDSPTFRGVQMIVCTGSMQSLPLRMISRSEASCKNSMRPSAILSALRTKPMLQKSMLQNCSRAAAMSSISRIFEVCEPFGITSNKHSKSVRSCSCTPRLRRRPSSLVRVIAALLMSANAITLRVIAEQVMRRDLYELNTNGTLLP